MNYTQKVIIKSIFQVPHFPDLPHLPFILPVKWSTSVSVKIMLHNQNATCGSPLHLISSSDNTATLAGKIHFMSTLFKRRKQEKKEEVLVCF